VGRWAAGELAGYRHPGQQRRFGARSGASPRGRCDGLERRGGHIINIGSVAGHEVYPGGSVYCATKHAVAALNRCLGIDTLGTGVRVSSVDPGMVETEFALVRFHGDAERADGVYEGIEALRGEDVAEAVIFCATRPPHANVREMILMPAAQATAVHSHRTR